MELDREIGRGRRAKAVCLALATCLAGLSSCASLRGGRYGLVDARKAGEAPARGSLIALPPTLVLLRDELPTRSYRSDVELSAARGEAESAQLLYRAGASGEVGFRLEARDLTGPEGETLRPELGVIGYVPLRRPSIRGFHRTGLFPDPILPRTEFSLAPGECQGLWYTVRVPRSAKPGNYAGSVSVIDGDGREAALPVKLRVYDVVLPATSFLKTSINFRGENAGEERYYGANWNAELEGQLPYLALAYRFSNRVDLHPLEVFSRGEDGPISADWEAFDARAEYWLGQGITCFELKLPISWGTSPRDIHEEFGPILELINAHIVGKKWVDKFYFYFYDEPSPFEIAALRERYEAIRQHAPAIRNLVTYGTTKAAERGLAGRVGIWVPNLHQLDASFAERRHALGEEVWAYACVQNAFRGFPDNFRIDWYGTAHRALGWWLFKQGADGFLYWAVDLWRRNPWETTETFPWTNGDGVLFYPALDGKSLPYASIRAHLMRDAFEDYDLLCLLRRAYAGAAPVPGGVEALLSAKEIIPRPGAFTTDDEAFSRCHGRMLELLEPKAELAHS